jgi:hypothetical protein
MLSGEWAILDRRRIGIRWPPKRCPAFASNAGVVELIALAAPASNRVSAARLSVLEVHRRPHHGQGQNRTNIDTQATAPKPERIMTKGMRPGDTTPVISYPIPTRPPTKKNTKIFNAVIDGSSHCPVPRSQARRQLDAKSCLATRTANGAQLFSDAVEIEGKDSRVWPLSFVLMWRPTSPSDRACRFRTRQRQCGTWI